MPKKETRQEMRERLIDIRDHARDGRDMPLLPQDADALQAAIDAFDVTARRMPKSTKSTFGWEEFCGVINREAKG